jgi:hypothetical protein
MPPIGPDEGSIVKFPFNIYLDKTRNGKIPNPCTYNARIELFEDNVGNKSTGVFFNISLTLYRGWS